MQALKNLIGHDERLMGSTLKREGMTVDDVVRPRGDRAVGSSVVIGELSQEMTAYQP